MAPSETITTVPEGQTVVSNGKLMNVTRSAGQVTYDAKPLYEYSKEKVSLNRQGNLAAAGTAANGEGLSDLGGTFSSIPVTP